MFTFKREENRFLLSTHPSEDGSLHAFNFKKNMTIEDSNSEDENKDNIEKKVDSGTEREVKEETVKAQKEEKIKKYEDPIKEDYHLNKENQFGKKHIHKQSWDIDYFDDEIL